MLLAQVAREAQDWEMRIARLGRVQLLSRFDVVRETTIDQDEYLDSEQSREHVQTGQALAAFALAHQALEPSQQKRAVSRKQAQSPAIKKSATRGSSGKGEETPGYHSISLGFGILS